MKVYQEQNVYDACVERINIVFDKFDNVCMSLSGGKDSSTNFQILLQEAKKRNRKFDVLYIDMEAQYLMTIQHIRDLIELAGEYIRDLYWVALPLSLRNAVSVFEPRWICWEKEKRDLWVRGDEYPKESINEDNNIFPFFRYAMEFEEFVPEFEKWYAEKNGGMCAHMVSICADESLNRWRTIASDKKIKLEDYQWTTKNRQLEKTYSVYPIYDWKVDDIWTAVAKLNLIENPVYELMYKGGMSVYLQRLCQPFGDDQKNGLDQYKQIEPDNWERLLNRVKGVNFGNIYCRTSALGNIKSEKPAHLSWQEWSIFLLESIGIYNPDLEKHYANKIRKFLQYWEDKCGVKLEDVPDEADKHLESQKVVPSWRRIGRALERNDFFMSRLSFGENKSDINYLKSMISKYDNLVDEREQNSKPLLRNYNKLKEENDAKTNLDSL